MVRDAILDSVAMVTTYLCTLGTEKCSVLIDLPEPNFPFLHLSKSQSAQKSGQSVDRRQCSN